MTAPMATVSGTATHPGLRRRLNEDSVLAHAPVFLVADGMGGHEAGEVASAAVVGVFARLVGRDQVSTEDIRQALTDARAAVEGIGDDQRLGAGTTVTGVGVAEHGGGAYWLVLNIGDSRTYRFAGGALEQISVDHSLVQELVDDGAISAEEARTHADRNVVTRAIGAGSESEADLWLLPATDGDRMLVCSDGLTGELDDTQIAQILAELSDPQDAAQRLVEEAVAHGGRDNVSVVVVDASQVRSGDGDPDDDDTLPRKPQEAPDVSL